MIMEKPRKKAIAKASSFNKLLGFDERLNAANEIHNLLTSGKETK